MAEKKELPAPLTEGEMLDVLILEATNQKTKSNILQRMHFILSLSGSKQMHENFMGQHQAQGKHSEDSIRTLLGFKQEWERTQLKDSKPVEKVPSKKPKEKVE